MKLRPGVLACASMVVLWLAAPAAAQYMRITTDNPTDNTRLRSTGTTILTITLDTNHDKSGTLQTCNTHQVAAGCPGAVGTAQPLDMFGYTIALRAVGGAVQWGTFTASDANYTNSSPQIQNNTEVEVNQFRPTGTFTPPGLATIGTIPVTILTGTPAIQLKIGYSQPTDLNPAGFGTGFATECDGTQNFNYYIVGDPNDPCGANPSGPANGLAGDWFDWDGAKAPGVTNTPPTITANPTSATAAEGTAMTPISATANDLDAANTLTITQSGMPASLTFTHTPGPSPRTATISGTPGFNDAGTYPIVWTVNDGAGGTASATTTLTITNTNRAPTLTQPANMTVNEGATAKQVLSGTDPDADALTFSKVSGPTYLTVTTTNATTGNISLAPGFSDAGTATATVRATDTGGLFNEKSLTVTVINVNQNPVLAQPANMTVNEGQTANQALSATDADGEALSFTKTAGPAYATVTTTSPGTGTAAGNLALAPGFSDSGTATISISVSDGSGGTDAKSLTATVINVDRPVVLAAINNMTVVAGSTADQAFSASDADGDAISFTHTGPSFMTRTDNAQAGTTRTGNIHLAPTSTTSGSFPASVTASSLATSDTKNFTISVTAVNNPPTLAQPSNMSVDEGQTANQTLTATDPDGNSLSFSKASGPAYATISVTDGIASDSKSLTITVNNVNRTPTLNAISNMTVNEGATADQIVAGSDPDGQALTFTKASGPAFMTVTTTNATTGNIHLAPSFTDAGTYGASASASDGAASDTKSFTITVNNNDRAPVVAPIANQTVAEGATADVAVSATDADGDVITLSASLPAFATLTSSPAAGTVTGTIHIAPAAGDAGTYAASVTASSGSPAQTNTRPFTITVTHVNRAPTLAQPSDMTVDEGATQDQVLNGSDPDGDALTFTKVTGPAFLTVTTTSPTTGTATGNAHLAPAAGDRGVYSAVVRVADGGGLTDQKSFNITVNAGANRPPVANPGGPYSGTVGVPVSFNGSGSTDPDGNPLTYAWDFGDGATGSGATPSHAYAAEGTFTVALTVTDNGTPPLSNTASTTATITNRVPANVFQYPLMPVKLNRFKDKSKTCFQIEPVNGSYRNTDVILSSIVLQYNGREAPANIDKTVINSDVNLNGIQEISACFSDAGLRFVFAGLSSGDHVVTVALEGNLTTGGRFHGETQITVRGPVTGTSRGIHASVSPNPLNPSSALSYVTQKPGSVKVELFDIQGRLVRTIVNESFVPAGVHEATIDGRGQRGEKLASGVYFVRGTTADGVFKNTITILK